MKRHTIGALLVLMGAAETLAGSQGYYRFPAISKDTIVFSAEGDLWKVKASGGTATRLTTHPGDETLPAISPDGSMLAFSAEYEGPKEAYVMAFGDAKSGLPKRITWTGNVNVVGWHPDGRVVYATDRFSTLPSTQLFLASPTTGVSEVVPLAQAAFGRFDDTGRNLFFTRLPFNGSFTKRYKGGTIQQIWRFDTGAQPLTEAVGLTLDFPGTSKDAMWWKGRVYFASDRDGIMNIWSMTPEGKDLQQHTRHKGFDVASPSLSEGRIAYQWGADIYVLDLSTGNTAPVPIVLESDFDQTRENWVEKPVDAMTSANISPDGDRVVLTARGRVFVAPAKQGRFVEATRKEGVRYRNARFMPDGKSIVALSDESGETELWTVPANGVGATTQLTTDADVLRWDTLPSPDGAWIAHHDKHWRLFIYDTKTRTNTQIDRTQADSFEGLTWSADSRYLAYVGYAENLFKQVRIYDTTAKKSTNITTDRFDSYSPVFSADANWLYLLSDRNLTTAVGSPWGARQPEPFFDRPTKVYQVALKDGLRSPFAPKDELQAEKKDDKKEEKKDASKNADAKTDAKADDKGKDEKKGEEKKKPASVEIQFDGIQSRLLEVPVPAGNYGSLMATEKALFFTSSEAVGEQKTSLVSFTITNENPELKTVTADIRRASMSQDSKKLLIHKGDSLCIVDANPGNADLDKKAVPLGAWSMSVTPREEWRQMFVEAWRLERDYFYDRNMHGVDWKAMLEKYRPLVDRVTTRGELSDLIAQMVAELSTLHTFVRGGDERDGPDNIQVASLAATLRRDEAGGGYRVDRVYRNDPDQPERAGPLLKPGVDVREGDVVEAINGTPTLSVADYAMLLRQKAGVQVLLRVKPATGGDSRDVIVTPVSQQTATDIRYHEWEQTRRMRVVEASKGRIGYVHLRAMGGNDFTDWARHYYPDFNKDGLIIDVRHNRGGNIDSWILSRLLRKVWFYWTDRAGNPPTWNMQQAFRGHLVILCDERTASDGEAITEGFRRLGLGKVIGTRTWGGEVWLSANNFLVDRGIATAGETGVYAPDGTWLIEGHGVDPDIVVDNPPHATFKGEDAQLSAAIEHLMKLIQEKPIPEVKAPKFPDKSFKE